MFIQFKFFESYGINNPVSFDHRLLAVAMRRPSVAATEAVPCVGAQGRDLVAAAFTVEAPAVIGALHAIVQHLAAGQRAPAVHAGVAEDVGRAGLIAKRDEAQPEQIDAQRRILRKLCRGTDRVPEINKHSSLRLSAPRHRSVRG